MVMVIMTSMVKSLRVVVMMVLMLMMLVVVRGKADCEGKADDGDGDNDKADCDDNADGGGGNSNDDGDGDGIFENWCVDGEGDVRLMMGMSKLRVFQVFLLNVVEVAKWKCQWE